MKYQNIELSNFIENCIDGSLSEYYIYNYFDENKNKIILHRSICYSTYDIYILIKNMGQCKNIIFNNNKNTTLKKAFENIYVDNPNFNQLINELTDSITKIKLEIMSIFHDKLRIIQKSLNIFDLIKEKINNIIFNKKVKSIVENTNILSKMYFKFNNEEKKFTITCFDSKELNSQFLDDITSEKQHKIKNL